ncbi:MAG: hypothetical protein WBP45_10190 [Daejeonella sp.]
MNNITKLLLTITSCVFCIACTNNTGKDGLKQTKDSVSISDSVTTKSDELPSGKAETALREFAFIANNKYIILSSSPDSAWVKGAPVLQQAMDNGIYSATMDVKAEALPQVYAGLLNKEFKVCGDKGVVLNAKIKSFKLLAAVIPHFGQVQAWNGEMDAPAATDKQKAMDIWKSGARYLVAEFEADKQSGKFYFAVPADKTRPVIFSSADIPEVKKKIIDLAAETKEYKTAQKDFLKNSENKNGNWWASEESSETFSFFEPDGGQNYAVLIHTGGNACGDNFYAEKFSIWTIAKDAAPTLTYMINGHDKVILAADIDGDKIPEFIIDDDFGNRSLLKNTAGKWTKTYTWNIPYLDSPC